MDQRSCELACAVSNSNGLVWGWTCFRREYLTGYPWMVVPTCANIHPKFLATVPWQGKHPDMGVNDDCVKTHIVGTYLCPLYPLSLIVTKHYQAATSHSWILTILTKLSPVISCNRYARAILQAVLPPRSKSPKLLPHRPARNLRTPSTRKVWGWVDRSWASFTRKKDGYLRLIIVNEGNLTSKLTFIGNDLSFMVNSKVSNG